MDWFRHYHGLCTDPKLHKASRMAKVHRSVAIAAWCAVLEAASQAEQRGAINGYDESDLAFMIDESKNVAGRILAAFAALGMVENGQVSAWAKRQFASDDVSVRVRKHRGNSSCSEKSSAKSEADLFHNPLNGRGTDPPCNVSETYRTEQIRLRKKEESPPPQTETPTPRASGAAAPSAAGHDPPPAVSESTISRMQDRLTMLGCSVAALRKRVDLLVAQRGSAAAVETAMLTALEHATGNPFAYALRILTRNETERIAAIEAAKVVALDPHVEPTIEEQVAAYYRSKEEDEKLARAYRCAAEQAEAGVQTNGEGLGGAEQSLH